MKQKIPNEILDIMTRCTVEGSRVRITCGQLDRKTYEALNKVLVALGGKWNRKAGVHLFESDPADIFEQAVLMGAYTSTKQDFNCFFTPPAMARRVVELADLHTGQSVFEPSAGQGSLLDQLPKDTFNIRFVEILDASYGVLKDKGYLGVCTDFLTVIPGDHTELFDRVVMNPPFSVQGERRADITHVAHAWKFLKPGGRLVSIMSAGVSFRTDKQTLDFREWVGWHSGEILPNPPDAFTESGTRVNTVTLVMDKPL